MVVIHNKCCSSAASAHCAEFLCFSEQLSLCQLGAAIALALEAKEAAVATKLYATNRTFITIGVNIFSPGQVIYSHSFCHLFFTDLGGKRAGL